MKGTELLAKIAKHVLCSGGQFQFNTFGDALRKTDHSPQTTGDEDAKLGQQTAQCVYRLGPLPNNQGPSPVQGQGGLLFDRLDLNKTHGGARDRFANRLGINCVRLAALHIRFAINRRDQPYFMAQLAQLARPVMAGAACFNPDQTRIKSVEKRQHLSTSE